MQMCVAKHDAKTYMCDNRGTCGFEQLETALLTSVAQRATQHENMQFVTPRENHKLHFLKIAFYCTHSATFETV